MLVSLQPESPREQQRYQLGLGGWPSAKHGGGAFGDPPARCPGYLLQNAWLRGSASVRARITAIGATATSARYSYVLKPDTFGDGSITDRPMHLRPTQSRLRSFYAGLRSAAPSWRIVKRNKGVLGAGRQVTFPRGEHSAAAADSSRCVALSHRLRVEHSSGATAQCPSRSAPATVRNLVIFIVRSDRVIRV